MRDTLSVDMLSEPNPGDIVCGVLDSGAVDLRSHQIFNSNSSREQDMEFTTSNPSRIEPFNIMAQATRQQHNTTRNRALGLIQMLMVSAAHSHVRSAPSKTLDTYVTNHLQGPTTSIRTKTGCVALWFQNTLSSRS